MADEADARTLDGPARSDDASASGKTPDSPGQQLRQARQAQQLEVSQLATSLRISTHVIEALERDDYERLPSAVFVAGYIRSYARLVGLDPEPLNQSFRRLHPKAEPPPRRIARSEGIDDDHEAGGLGPYLLGALVILALAAGGYGWWVTTAGGDRESAPPATASSAGEEPPEQSPILATETQDVQAPEPNRDSTAAGPDSPEASSTKPIQTPSADVVLIEPGEQAPDPTPAQTDGRGLTTTSEPSADLDSDASLVGSVSEPAGAVSVPEPAGTPLPTPTNPAQARPAATEIASAPEDIAAAAAQTGPDAEAGAGTEPAAEIELPPAADATPPPVELAFSGPCWVDIRDSTGKVLLFGEMSRGDRETLGGEPPYSLVLGNAAAAEVTVAGQPYDLSSIARGNVARFELDPAEVDIQTTAEDSGPAPNARRAESADAAATERND